jgi:hypothetical protein
MRPGFFANSKRLVASSSFQLRNSDVQINIDRFGQLQISESRFGRDWNGHDWNDHNYGRGNDRNYDKGSGHDYKHDNGNQDRNF